MLNCPEHNRCTNKKVLNIPKWFFFSFNLFFPWKTLIFQTGSNQYSLVISIYLSQHHTQRGCSISKFIFHCLQAKAQILLPCAALLIRGITVNLLQQKRHGSTVEKGDFKRNYFILWAVDVLMLWFCLEEKESGCGLLLHKPVFP